MQDNRDNKLSDAERTAMHTMASAQAPFDLEDRTVATLMTHGLINKKGGFRMKLITTFAAASAIALSFVSGVMVTKSRTSEPVAVTQPTPVTGTNEYMLLMFMEKTGDEAPREMTPEESAAYEEGYQAIIAEYRGWAEERRAEGRLVSAEKLEDTARILTATQTTSTLPDGRVLGGYFLIRANSIAEAEEIASTHPHIRYGGAVEIRPIDADASARE